MNANEPVSDYLAPGISELARRRRSAGDAAVTGRADEVGNSTHAVAKRLLPACVVVPALLWWALAFGAHRGWYSAEVSFALFAFSVTAVFGVIVCLNLRKLSRTIAQNTQAQEQLRVVRRNLRHGNDSAGPQLIRPAGMDLTVTSRGKPSTCPIFSCLVRRY